MTPFPLPQWLIRSGNILDTPAEVLICSANVNLNMSGGVGGAILVQYGDRMQQELRQYLAERRIFQVEPGTVVRTTSCGTNFRFVFHAVAIDVFYQSSHEIVVSTIRQALRMSAECGAKSVALAALATGYGKFPLQEFAAVIRELREEPYPPIETVDVVLQNPWRAEELTEYLNDYCGVPKKVDDE